MARLTRTIFPAGSLWPVSGRAALRHFAARRPGAAIPPVPVGPGLTPAGFVGALRFFAGKIS
ncbi:MAG TPA: hypothetical protein VFJ88_04485, partial [Chthoniobacterales bacterium]|nr:hypothetical protein [Chthoniobacterales bacterium]